MADEANRTKSVFLANMSHELRTPLNAIIGYSEILQEDAVDLGQQVLVADLKKIEGAGRHLLSLINDILDLSKIEAGRMDVFIEDVEVVPLLEEVRAIIEPMAKKNGNAVEFRMAENLGTVRMPEMSGFEVLRRLKAAEHTGHIPVIIISALDEIDSVVRCIEAGAEDYLTKPFNPTLLRARIGASLEKKWLRDRENNL
ncbi:MAG TPA: histidine kinase dimerization/phospho-acceptor domain-containing protein [Steroidobacteraceae bacterium]